ncbi:MAG: Txe/YoeB family addiction module toxin [Bacteroidetes bacterium CG_4_10_14_3_um_filter_31_20]|nr:Txe/YoeB family addiction module toxin [Bacteroidota bacterium]PIY07430.1 MAG: Txe/YoeB family addiction module toxin [Bacteroidetes bacterium CG_4_10_14_3_um_filter_31_20]
MTKFIFDDNALEQYSDWARENIKLFDKIEDLLKDIKRNPFKGIGKPEPLKHQHRGCWSRRIDDKHRLVYRVSSDEIHIISCKGHYS